MSDSDYAKDSKPMRIVNGYTVFLIDTVIANTESRIVIKIE
jgi:hypothetical protein